MKKSALRAYPNERSGQCSRRREEADATNRATRSASSRRRLQELFGQVLNFFRRPRLQLTGVVALALCFAQLAVGAELVSAPAGKALSISVKNLEGASVQPLADAGQKATVLFFVMHECPVANGYAPEIARIMSEYSAKGIRSCVVYVENDLTPAKAREHARDYGFKSGAVLDPKHLLVKAAGATISPEAAVLSPAGEVLYRGRIDDRVADFGKRRVEPTRRDLRLTLDAILAGQPVSTRLTKAIGCYIPEDHSSKLERK